MAEMAGMTGCRREALELIALVTTELKTFAVRLRQTKGVSAVASKCEPFRSEDRSGIEWYVDAELLDGRALSWNLLLYCAVVWNIEASISRVDHQGSQTIWRLERAMVTEDDIDQELISVLYDLARIDVGAYLGPTIGPPP